MAESAVIKRENEIEEYNKKWKYEYEIIRDSNNRLKFTIEFFRPIYLPKGYSGNQKAIEEIQNMNDKKDLDSMAKNRLDSLIRTKYKEKMKESFNSYIRIKTIYQIVNKLKNDSNLNILDVLELLEQEDFQDINDDEINLYVTKYMQYKKEIENIEREDIEKHFDSIHYLSSSNKRTSFNKSLVNFNAIKDKYKSLSNKYEERFKNILPFKEFIEILISPSCTYCGITLTQIEQLREDNKIYSKSGRGFSLEIDRKYPNDEYTKDNCCMSCYWCNNAKTDEFNVEEFEEIAKGINLVWRERGANIIEFKEIPFWKER